MCASLCAHIKSPRHVSEYFMGIKIPDMHINSHVDCVHLVWKHDICDTYLVATILVWVPGNTMKYLLITDIIRNVLKLISYNDSFQFN